MYDRLSTNNKHLKLEINGCSSFKLLSCKVLVMKRYKRLKSRLLFEEIANFTSKLLQNYKKWKCESFRILFKGVGKRLSVLFYFTLH